MGRDVSVARCAEDMLLVPRGAEGLPGSPSLPWPSCLLLAAAPVLEWRSFAQTVVSHYCSMLGSHRAGGKQ